MCEQYQGRLTPQIEWYTDFNEAVVNDLAYFEDQFGISAAGADQLMKKLEN